MEAEKAAVRADSGEPAGMEDKMLLGLGKRFGIKGLWGVLVFFCGVGCWVRGLGLIGFWILQGPSD